RPMPVPSLTIHSCIATIPISAKATTPIQVRPRFRRSSRRCWEIPASASRTPPAGRPPSRAPGVGSATAPPRAYARGRARAAGRRAAVPVDAFFVAAFFVAAPRAAAPRAAAPFALDAVPALALPAAARPPAGPETRRGAGARDGRAVRLGRTAGAAAA